MLKNTKEGFFNTDGHTVSLKNMLILGMPDARAIESFSGYLNSMGGFFEYLVSPFVSDEEALTALRAGLKP